MECKVIIVNNSILREQMMEITNGNNNKGCNGL